MESFGWVIALIGFVLAGAIGFIDGRRKNQATEEKKKGKILDNVARLREAFDAYENKHRSRPRVHVRRLEQGGMFFFKAGMMRNPEVTISGARDLLVIAVSKDDGSVRVDDENYSINATTSDHVQWQGFIRDMCHELDIRQPARRAG